MAGGRRRGGSGRRGAPRQHPGTLEPAPAPAPPSATATTVTHRNAGAAPKPGRAKKPAKEPAATAPDVDSLGFQAMDRNVPGLSHVILQKLNMKSYEDYKSAMDGRKSGSDFGIRTYFEMFQKMEDTFKFCAECKKLPDALPDPKSLRRCKRCQNVYYCGVACQRANWPLHKKFCKKLKLVALDRLVEWLVFTGGAGDAGCTPPGLHNAHTLLHGSCGAMGVSLLLACGSGGTTPGLRGHHCDPQCFSLPPQETSPFPQRPGQSPPGTWRAGRTGSPCRSSWRRSWVPSWPGGT
uniref:MYND-type domain-containing protein n=1 Tax=Strigops habroptila TaxID=2489341 RepID=A0A672TRG1_STRHB